MRLTLTECRVEELIVSNLLVVPIFLRYILSFLPCGHAFCLMKRCIRASFSDNFAVIREDSVVMAHNASLSGYTSW